MATAATIDRGVDGFDTSGVTRVAPRLPEPRQQLGVRRRRQVVERQADVARGPLPVGVESQRHEGGAVHYPFSHGGANSFELDWPAVRNINVYRSDLSGVNPGLTFWLDQTKPPFSG